MTELELITNFIDQYPKPFTAETASMLTGIARDKILPVFIDMEKQKRIKRIYEHPQDIYVRSNRYNSSVCTTNDRWNLNLTQANELLDLLEKGRYGSLRDIAIAIGRSRQWVYVYLEALASIDCIDLRNFRYVVISRKPLPKLGTKVIKGILGQLRSLNKIGGYRDLDTKPRKPKPSKPKVVKVPKVSNSDKPKKTKLKTKTNKRSASQRTHFSLI